jgi:hypothetical protein
MSKNTQPKSSKQQFGNQAGRTDQREWTAVEKFRLKGLAKQAYSADKIARVLKRPVDATVVMASRLGLQLM